jgi:hypothetical protein
MAKVPDEITLKQLCEKAAQALARAGMQHRIDIYRDVEVDDPAVRMMLGRRHRVRVRVKITAASMLFENDEPAASSLDATTVEPSTPRRRAAAKANVQASTSASTTVTADGRRTTRRAPQEA